MLTEEPPHTVLGNTVHVFVRRSDVSDKVEGFRNDFICTEYCENSRNLGVHVSRPDKSVSLNSVPEVSLHIEVYRISGGVVDFCHKRIAALKISLVFDVAEHKNGADRAYLGKYIGIEQLYISKTESAFVCFV